jgi:hypothetical protein
MPRRTIGAILIAALVLACGGRQYRDLPSFTPTQAAASPSDVPAEFEARYAVAATSVTLFHVRFDQRNFNRIYAAADDSFRAATSEAAFTARLTELRERVGMSRSEDEISVDIAPRGQDLLVTITMETIFEKATLVETFVWRVTPSEMALLVRYETR